MKVFTVTIQGGTKDIEYEAYIRLLKEWKIDVTDTLRVLEKGTLTRWVYAWRKRADAERFAEELRKRTRNRTWYVHEFQTDQLSQGSLIPVEIAVSRRSDGYTYGLHPNSQMLIRQRFPNARMVPSVFIGSETQASFERDHPESIWDHVVMILTGLNEEQLNELGGYRVYDPESDKVLREPESLKAASKVEA
jgi:hypothetical protein